jgi:polyhydroxybutyrate depolymerase
LEILMFNHRNCALSIFAIIGRSWTMAALLLFSTATMADKSADKLQSLTHDGQQRSFLVHDFSSGHTASLVIVLHGGGGNALNVAEQTGFDRVAQREKLIVVYPNGSGRRKDKLLTWNAGHCCAYALQHKIDDVGFISALIDHLLANYPIDPARVYVTGLSNGGMMTHRIGYMLSDKVAAIAPVIAALFGDEPQPTQPVPTLIINGAVDETVPANGGTLGATSSSRPLLRHMLANAADRPVLPALAQVDYWAKTNGCQYTTSSQQRNALWIQHTDCRRDADVQFYSVSNNGHAWPGGTAPRDGAAKPVTDFDASEVIWAFFKQHPRH